MLLGVDLIWHRPIADTLNKYWLYSGFNITHWYKDVFYGAFFQNKHSFTELEDKIVSLRESKSVADIAIETDLGVATIYRVLADKNITNE